MKKKFQYLQSTISYRVEGAGKTVVLLHGFAEDSTIFNHQINFLKNYCQLIVPDLPGSGLSEILDDGEKAPAITIKDYALCIHSLLQHENITTCILLGHSMGGYITLAFAELYPQMLNAFGLIHSSAFADTDEKKQNRQRGIEMIEQYGVASFLKNTIPNLFAKQFKEAYPQQVESLIESCNNFSKAALQQYYRAMMNRPDTTHVLRNNPLPVLFVMGTEDMAVPLNDVVQQTHLPLCSYIHVLENVGHMSMWEATAQLNQYLLDFIQMWIDDAFEHRSYKVVFRNECVCQA